MEDDIVQEAFFYVLENKQYTDMVNELDVGGDQFWNSDLFDGESNLIWSPDNFTKSCSIISRKCQQIDEKLRITQVADILACLKFESHGFETQNSQQRSLHLSTGFSISVENLFPRNSETDLLSDYDGDLFLNNSDLSDDDLDDFYDHVNQRKHLVDESLPYGSEPDGCYVVYSNPFDPGLTFQGLVDVFSSSKTSRTVRRRNNLNTNASGPPNFLLAFEDPVAKTNDYFQDYRKLANHWSHDLPHVIRRPWLGDNSCLGEIERIARRNIDDFESEQLWIGISSTRHLWPEDAPLTAYSPPRFVGQPIRPLEATLSIAELDAVQETSKDPEGENEISTEVVAEQSEDIPSIIGSTTTSTATPQAWVKHVTQAPEIDVLPLNTRDDTFPYPIAGTNGRIRGPCDGQTRYDIYGTSVDRMETDVDVGQVTVGSVKTKADLGVRSTKMNAGNIIGHRPPLRYPDESSHLVYREEQRYPPDPQQRDSPESKEHEPLLKFPYDSSMFWKDYGDISQLDAGTSEQGQSPSRPPQDSAQSCLAPIVHHKEYQPPAIQYSSPVLLPHLAHHPAPPPSLLQLVGRPPHHQRFPLVHARAIPRGNRAMPNANCQPPPHTLSQSQAHVPQPPLKHCLPRPPPLPANFQIPPPLLQPNQTMKVGNKAAYQPIRHPFPLFHLDILHGRNAEMKPVPYSIDNYTHRGHKHPHTQQQQQVLHPLATLDIRTTQENQHPVYKQQSKQPGCPKNMFEPDCPSSVHEQCHRVLQPEPAFVLPCLNVSAPSFSSEARIPFLIPTSPGNCTKYPNKGESQVTGQSDSNFRLDDEIWYINGIPHRHARPMHSLQSSAMFNPRDQQLPCDANNGGINRRIAEQVAKINQTFIDPSHEPTNSLPEGIPSTNTNVNQCKGETGDIINLYPVYSYSGMNDSNNANKVPRHHWKIQYVQNTNNNNIDENDDIADTGILNDLNRILASSEDADTYRDIGDLGLDVLYHSSDEDEGVTCCETEPNANTCDVQSDIDKVYFGKPDLTTYVYRNDAWLRENDKNEYQNAYHIGADSSRNILNTYSYDLDFGFDETTPESMWQSVKDTQHNYNISPSYASQRTGYHSPSHSLDSDCIPYNLEYASSQTSLDSDNMTNSTEYASSCYSLESDISPRSDEENLMLAHGGSSVTDVMAEHVAERHNKFDSNLSSIQTNGYDSDPFASYARPIKVLRRTKILEENISQRHHQQSGQSRSNLTFIGTSDPELDQYAGARHIRVLGRNRHQKEKERSVRKRKEINRKVLVQLV